MKIFKIRCLKRYGSAKHGEQEHTERPYINEEPFVTFVNNDFWSEIGRGAALLLDDLAFLYYLRNTKITNLDSFFAIEEDVIKFDISVYD